MNRIAIAKLLTLTAVAYSAAMMSPTTLLGQGGDRETLRQLGAPTSDSALHQFLRGLIRTPERTRQVRKLIDQLGAKSFFTRDEAERRLAQMSVPPISELQAAAADSDPEIALRSRRLLQQLVGGTPERRMIGVLRYLHRHPLPGAVTTLIRLGPACGTQPQLTALRAAIRAHARQAKFELIDEKTRDKDIAVRSMATFALGGVNDRRVVDRLFELSRDTDSDVKLAAATALADRGEASAAGLFGQLLDHRQATIRRRAQQMLRAMFQKQLVSNDAGNMGTIWRSHLAKLSQANKRSAAGIGTPQENDTRDDKGAEANRATPDNQASQLGFNYPLHQAAVVQATLLAKGRVLLGPPDEPQWYDKEIPPGRIRLLGVELRGQSIEPDFLRQLAEVETLRELRLSHSVLPQPQILGDLFDLEVLDLTGSPSVADQWFRSLRTLVGLRSLKLGDTSLTGRGLAALADLPQLEELDLSGCRRLENRYFVEFGNMSNLRKLSLVGAEQKEAGLESLARCERLEDLRLGRAATDDNIAAIAKLPLKSLRIQYGPVTSYGLKLLSTNRTLKYLDLYRCAHIDDMGVRYIGELRQLESLRLVCPQITDQCMPAISQLRRLKKLSLYSSGITAAGCKYLRSLRSLTWLSLAHTRVDSLAGQHLARLRQLRYLNLRNTEMADAGLEHIGKLPRLEVLVLESTPVHGTGLTHLRNCRRLAELYLHNCRLETGEFPAFRTLGGLRLLDVSNTMLSDADVAALAAAPNLQQLDLSKTRVGDFGFVQLAKAKQLKVVRIRLTTITANAEAQVRQGPSRPLVSRATSPASPGWETATLPSGPTR